MRQLLLRDGGQRRIGADEMLVAGGNVGYRQAGLLQLRQQAFTTERGKNRGTGQMLNKGNDAGAVRKEWEGKAGILPFKGFSREIRVRRSGFTVSGRSGPLRGAHGPAVFRRYCRVTAAYNAFVATTKPVYKKWKKPIGSEWVEQAEKPSQRASLEIKPGSRNAIIRRRGRACSHTSSHEQRRKPPRNAEADKHDGLLRARGFTQRVPSNGAWTA